MAETRKVRQVIKGKPTVEGAGVHLRRLFGFAGVGRFDPFLLLDDFRSDAPELYRKGFPWHPHRGIETITYVLRGDVEHGDSLGNRGVISSGDVQWMTAGSGIIHQEMPKGDPDGAMYGFQLWANLPAAQKMMDPRYREVKAGQIPEVARENGTKIRIICGAADGVGGPVQDVVTDPSYLDVSMPPETAFRHAIPRGHTAFAYVIGGRAAFCGATDPFSYDTEESSYFDLDRDRRIGDGSLVLFADGDEVAAATALDPVRFLLISGKPIGEPIAWYGPIVMNTQDELRTAYEELEAGTFIKSHRPSTSP
jgi:redox-sensitive bicupin YhaK (pirin superfamily)